MKFLGKDIKHQSGKLYWVGNYILDYVKETLLSEVEGLIPEELITPDIMWVLEKVLGRMKR